MDNLVAYPTTLSSAVEHLRRCAVPGGGFSPTPGLPHRSDATAWAALVLATSNRFQDSVGAARLRLVSDQLEDGRVPIASSHHESFWPTSLAILAWAGSSAYRESQARAVQFLLKTTGRHWKRERDTPFAHDPAIQGWPWIDETHSWVEPTALAVTALTSVGHDEHPRVQEAVRMLLDRQLPHGGWNYGNTKVFGQELLPAPDSTGAALHALAGRVPEQHVAQSLEYLTVQIRRVHTPITLGWGMLGLRAWNLFPLDAEALITGCLARQDRYGGYDTSSLCLLLLPLLNPSGLLPREVTHVAAR